MRRVDPVTSVQHADPQRHWIPDIASRFRNDEQNQNILDASANLSGVTAARLQAPFSSSPRRRGSSDFRAMWTPDALSVANAAHLLASSAWAPASAAPSRR
jgi:hypothetical protein